MAVKTYIIFGIIGLVFLGLIGATYLLGCEDDWCFHFEWQKINAVNSFDECVARGYPVMESYPRQCKAGNKTFVEDINTNLSQSNINSIISPACKIGGCSNQLCVDQDEENTVTTCEFLPEYSCYQKARCEKQSDGKCGWTQTLELQSCIENARKNSL